jgi:hypothetical protein
MKSAGRSMTPQPLTDAEFDSVRQVLERFGDKRSMNLEALDGFLAAVSCGPRTFSRASASERFGETISSTRTRSRLSPS